MALLPAGSALPGRAVCAVKEGPRLRRIRLFLFQEILPTRVKTHLTRFHAKVPDGRNADRFHGPALWEIQDVACDHRGGFDVCPADTLEPTGCSSSTRCYDQPCKEVVITSRKRGSRKRLAHGEDGGFHEMGCRATRRPFKTGYSLANTWF